MDSQKIYNQIGKEVQEEKENKAKELLSQEEEKKKREKADLANTINTNINPKNREAFNNELRKIAAICSGFETKYHKNVDSIEIKGVNKEKESLIRNIFKLIHIELKRYYLNDDFEGDSKIRIPQCEYKIFFDKEGCLNISERLEEGNSGTANGIISYNIVYIKKEIKKSNIEGFYYDGFEKRGCKDSDIVRNFY